MRMRGAGLEAEACLIAEDFNEIWGRGDGAPPRRKKNHGSDRCCFLYRKSLCQRLGVC